MSTGGLGRFWQWLSTLPPEEADAELRQQMKDDHWILWGVNNSHWEKDWPEANRDHVGQAHARRLERTLRFG